MKTVAKSTLSGLALCLALGGCAVLSRPQPLPGEPLAAVTARLGKPSAIYPLADGQELEYANGPFGQTTYMARFGADGALRSYEQVLSSP